MSLGLVKPHDLVRGGAIPFRLIFLDGSGVVFVIQGIAGPRTDGLVPDGLVLDGIE